MKQSGAICGVSRGRYIAPMPIGQAGLTWVDEEDEPISIPEKHHCEHENHWQWGKGTRNGQKLYFPTEKMFYQKWKLTNKEMKEAFEQYDMFSLEMRGRVLCEECAERELKIISK